MKEWLCHNLEPETKVKDFMQKTAIKRAALLRDENFRLDQIIKEFPRLFDTPGMVSTSSVHKPRLKVLYQLILPRECLLRSLSVLLT